MILLGNGVSTLPFWRMAIETYWHFYMHECLCSLSWSTLDFWNGSIMVETVALYCIFGQSKTKTQATYWWGFSPYTQFTGEIIVVLYSMMEDSLCASKKKPKGNEWVRRITSVSTRLQRKTVTSVTASMIYFLYFGNASCTFFSHSGNPLLILTSNFLVSR